MKIKKAGNLIIVESQKAKAVYPIDTNKYKPSDEHNIVLYSKTEALKAQSNSLIINSPGEYEANDIFVYALSDDKERIKLFSVDLENINVVIFDSKDDILKLLDSDDISENNVLVCNLDGDLKNVSEIIDELEPNVLILTGKNETGLNEALKKLSLNPSDSQTYFNFSEDDFSEENEQPMRVVLLK